ncbi:hypothetical protein O7626_10435 [Micromonospora sp. WMMD1102]|uniref:hypothetical protein n=1 Tax=Micromonospora sp. WMMD1102 TaxID=3016105 RepID=UPI0024155E68|nr:hypothetical protein [Micromonospora sp. WMMD1102]MDG4786340.1 hypothetical protein [Micromonospora sp. WMMD1102]
MTIHKRLHALVRGGRHRRMFPILALLAGVAGAHSVTLMAPRSYEAVASVMVVPQRSDNGGVTGITVAQNLAPTVARLAESRQVAAATATVLGLAEDSVAGRVHGASEPGLQIVTIRAAADTGPRAAAIANAVTDALSSEVGQLRIGGESPVSAEPLDRAAPPRTPQTPKPLLNLALGGIAGLLAGLALASVGQRFDNRLRRLDQIEKCLRLPVVGALPPLPRRPSTQAIPLYDRPEVAAAVDATVAAVSVLTATSSSCRILVAGIRDTASVDLVAGLLALGLARHRKPVTLVESRTSQPTLAKVFPGSERCTLQQVIAGDRVPQPVSGVASLAVVPADPIGRSFGAQPPGTAQVGILLDQLAGRSGVVVSTAGPLLAGVDLALLAQHADTVLLVVHADRTREGEASRAALLLRRLDVPLLGLVVVGGANELDAPVSAAWPAARSGRRRPHRGLPDIAVPAAPIPAATSAAAPIPAATSAAAAGHPYPPSGARTLSTPRQDRPAEVPRPVPEPGPLTDSPPASHLPRAEPEQVPSSDLEPPILARFRAALQREGI